MCYCLAIVVHDDHADPLHVQAIQVDLYIKHQDVEAFQVVVSPLAVEVHRVVLQGVPKD